MIPNTKSVQPPLFPRFEDYASPHLLLGMSQYRLICLIVDTFIQWGLMNQEYTLPVDLQKPFLKFVTYLERHEND